MMESNSVESSQQQQPKPSLHDDLNENLPICNIILIGFHHKKGCQIEFSYPTLDIDLENSNWKNLPHQAIPDGSHHYASDFCYFHLPSLDGKETIFAVSCYQQIDADKIKNKTEDITRSTVQKSVCVLSKYPFYGHIQVKMSLITAALFREGDFKKTSILKEAYHNLNSCLSDRQKLLSTPESLVGLSPRDLVFLFRHQILLLFKILLLEKKVLFLGSSVGPLSSAILTLVSLIPNSLYGLNKSACVYNKKQTNNSFEDGSADCFNSGTDASSISKNVVNDSVERNSYAENRENDNINEELKSSSEQNVEDSKHSKDIFNSKLNRKDSIELKSSASENSLTEEKCEDIPCYNTAVQMSANDVGLPLNLFEDGYLLHPYISLHYMDLLLNTRGFVIGASNVLFKQKKDLVDVIVEMQDGSIIINDLTLKKNVALTTADLRFAEYIVKQCSQDPDTFLDGTEYLGGDEWLRSQLTSLVEENRHRDNFYSPYLSCWQNTNNWKKWNEYINSEERQTPGIYLLCPGHPCDGNISMSDMKIRIAHTFQNTEGGRKINQAVLNTGKAVAQTSKNIGGAFTKISSWFNTSTNPVTPSADPKDDEEIVEKSHLPINFD